MAERYVDFMVSLTDSAPRSLHESVRLLSNASSGFCRSWIAGETTDAIATSEEAFGLLDHIQNELLRRRDDRRLSPAWMGSPLQVALAGHVGELVEPTTPALEAAFISQAIGSGLIPPGTTTAPLKLADALNKLKHRSSSKVNFAVSPAGQHLLVVLTLAGSGRPNSLSAFDVQTFCVACRLAASAA